MGVNRFFKRTPYDIGLYVPPIDIVKSTLEDAQKKYDTNYMLTQNVKNNIIQSLPQDRALANQIQNEWSTKVDEIAAKYNGDYSRAGKDIAGLISGIRKDYNPGGRAAAITGNYASYNDWLARHRERIKAGKVLGEDLNQANSYFMSKYQGIGEIDPVTGSYNMFTPDDLADYQDPDAIIQDVYKNFKPQAYERSETIFKNGLQTDVTSKYDGISPDRLYPSFNTALTTNPKLASYLSQKAKYNGMSDSDVAGYMDSLAKQRAKDLSYMNKSEGAKSVRDPLTMLYAHGAQERALAKYKSDLKKEEIDSMFRGDYQYENTTGSVYSAEPNINPNNWRESTSGVTNISPLAGEGIRAYSANVTVPEAAQTQSLEQFLNSPKARDRNINVPLAKQMYEDMKNDTGGAYGKNYMRNKSWTQNFEKDFWNRYMEQHKNATAMQTKSLVIPQVSVNTVLQNQLPDLMSGNATVYRPGDKVSQSANSMGIDKSKYVDEKTGKIRQDISARYVFAGTPGFIEGGFLLNGPDGSIVIVDQNAARQDLNKEIKNAFNPIFLNGGTEGRPMEISKGVYGTPKIKFQRDEQGNYSTRNYFSTPGKDDILSFYDPERGGERPITITDALDQYAPRMQSMLDLGAGKADMTKNILYNLFGQE